jgi:hypothetical protein
MRYKKMDCEHDKAYSKIILTSYPPQYQWVCKKCGQKGRDIQSNFFMNDEYEETIKVFEEGVKNND